MKLISYTTPDDPAPRAALLEGALVIELSYLLGTRYDMLALLRYSASHAAPGTAPLAWLAERWQAQRGAVLERALPLDSVQLCAPLPNPTSLRDFYAFEEHVRTARARRGLEVVPEWYQMPVFYFSNHQAILGPGEPVRRPRGCEWLDWELEIAAVIGRSGRDIAVEEAGSYIAGYTILNDWSARDVQREEMKVGLGPAKGKDFASTLGPALVTPDELAERRAGKGYDLTMVARRNRHEVSRGNWRTIYYSFEEMIARASQDVTLYPGDVIGSGTVGTGCILEVGPEAAGGWLQPGDEVELEVEHLGLLRSPVA